MFTKFYWGLWIVLALTTVGLFAGGQLGWLEMTVIGFMACLFIFMGMICVTPTLVGPHASEYDHGDAEIPVENKRTKPIKAESFPAGAVIQNRHA
jgi:hypothetical protein